MTLGRIGFALASVALLVRHADQVVVVTEDLRIGSVADNRYRFYSVGPIRAVSDALAGTLVLKADGWYLAVFDAKGTIVWERNFAVDEVPGGMEVLGDTLAVLSSAGGAARVTFFRIGGRQPLATFPIPTDPGSQWTLRGVTNRSLLLVAQPIAVGGGFSLGAEVSSGLMPVYSIRYLDLQGGLAEGWRLVDSSVRPVVPHPRPGVSTRIVLLLPWAPVVTFAASASETYVASQNSYEISVRDVSGRATRIINVSYVPRRIDENMKADWIAAWKNGFISAIYADSIKTQIDNVPFPETIPPIRALMTDPDGTIAVIRRDLDKYPVRGSDSVRVDIVSKDGMLERQVRLPPGVSVRAVNRASVFAVIPATRSAGETANPDVRPTFQIVKYRYR